MAAIATIPVDIISITPGQTYSHITFKVIDRDDDQAGTAFSTPGLAGVGAEVLAIDVLNTVISAGSIVPGPASLAFTQP
jgi:hypothetical protein